MRGVTVKLKVKTETGTDSLGMPTYSEDWVNVDDVLVGEPSSADVENNLTMYGKRTKYTLAIPKGDANYWEDTEVELPAPWSQTFATIGRSTIGIEANVPTRWNRKVHLESVEG